MIELENVSLKYQTQESYALSNVSMSIRDGECVLLCGKSGCGKSSVLKIINGMIPDFYDGQISGKVNIDGINPQECSLYELSFKVGTVFQNPRTQFYTVNTTSEIAFGCENHGVEPERIRNRIKEVAVELHIEDLLDKNIFRLSGGEKQKIALASIYAMNPDIYILDEPSSNLDFKAMHELADILKLLKSKGKTIVIAEHRLWYLRELVDTVYYMEDGIIMPPIGINDLGMMSEEQRLKTGIRNLNLERLVANNFKATNGLHQLELKNVSVSYKKDTVLSVDDFNLSAGKVIAIIGDNGAGKTTFISTICGYLKRQQGRILCDNQTIKKRRRVKDSFMVMQDVNHQLFTNSVYDEVTLGIETVNDDELKDIFNRMDIDGIKERHPMTLSGGQKQRVASACAAACGKNVVVFDEPTSGLDYYHMIETSNLIKNMVDENRFIFIITHDYEFILKTCNAVIRIEKGKVVENYDLTDKTISNLKRVFLI